MMLPGRPNKPHRTARVLRANQRLKPMPRVRIASPPFEKNGADHSKDSSTFAEVVFRFMPLKARRQWMNLPQLRDFRVFQCGFYGKASGHAWERHGLAEGVYIYCTAGKGCYRQGKRSWKVGPGDLLYCFPNTHHAYSADQDDPWTIHWLHVSGPRVPMFEKLLGFSTSNPVIPIGIHLDIVELFRSLFTLFRPVNEPARLAAIQACAQLLLATMAVVPRPAMVVSQRAREVQAVINYMERSLEANLRLADLANYVGMSPFHFSRVFKAVAHLTPIEYFGHLRIRKACMLLETSSLKIKEVAHQVGFEDPYYFSRCFKKLTGTSPAAYRANL